MAELKEDQCKNKIEWLKVKYEMQMICKQL